jgi:alpha-1,2-mannosyltransferase
MILGVGTIAFYWMAIIIEPRGDFPSHWELGRRLIAGEYLYASGLNFVYPPFWGLAHAPLALLDLHFAQVVGYALAPLSIFSLLRIMHRLASKQLHLESEKAFWSATLAVALALNFITRDLPEIGVNTALVSLSWLAIYLWTEKRDIAGGISLGLAGALKCTPLLFVAYFALKRQWKIAAAAAFAFTLFTLAPIVVQGPELYGRAIKAWTGAVASGMMDPDPSRGPLGEEKVENLALRPALARYLMRLPYGHLGRPETSDTPDRPNQPPNSYYFQFLDLPPRVAGVVAQVLMAGLLIFVAWRFRNRVVERAEISVLYECAAVSLLILLYSPITWKQHAVGVLPALFLICRQALATERLPRWIAGAVATYALFATVFSREIIGRDMVKLLDSYRVKTIAILLLTAAVLGCRRISRNKRERGKA